MLTGAVLQLNWSEHTLSFAVVDFLIMLLLTIFSVAGIYDVENDECCSLQPAGMAHVGSRQDVRGFLYICSAAFVGSAIAALLRLRPSLALVCPPLLMISSF